jgi:hypothetical protein
MLVQGTIQQQWIGVLGNMNDRCSLIIQRDSSVNNLRVPLCFFTPLSSPSLLSLIFLPGILPLADVVAECIQNHPHRPS